MGKISYKTLHKDWETKLMIDYYNQHILTKKAHLSCMFCKTILSFLKQETKYLQPESQEIKPSYVNWIFQLWCTSLIRFFAFSRNFSFFMVFCTYLETTLAMYLLTWRRQFQFCIQCIFYLCFHQSWTSVFYEHLSSRNWHGHWSDIIGHITGSVLGRNGKKTVVIRAAFISDLTLSFLISSEMPLFSKGRYVCVCFFLKVSGLLKITVQSKLDLFFQNFPDSGCYS